MAPFLKLRPALARLITSASIALGSFGVAGCGNSHAPGPALESAAKILDTTQRFTTRLVTIKTSKATVVTTPEHPFAKRGSGWTPAIQLAPGDQLEHRGSEQATVLSVEVRDVPPTPVYNLTVAKTHSYFVSSQDLLVHNANCGTRSPTLGELLQKERDAETGRNAPRRHTLRELLDREKWQERRDSLLNDTRGTRNCGVCSIAGLSDADKLSVFLLQHAHNDKLWNSHEEGMYDDEARQHLKDLRLVGPTTPKHQIFPPPQRRELVEHATRKSKQPNFPDWPEVTEFMHKSTSNTFYVEVEFWTPRGPQGHAMLGVRDVDGSIKFVDLQKIPPAIVDPEEARIYKVDVTPTDVDWRFNHQINRVVSGSK